MVLLVISLLVAIIVISVVYLQKKEIELVYSVLALLLVVISLWILRRVIKIANIRIIITEKLRIHKKEFKKVVHSLIGLILSIIIAIIAGHGRPAVEVFSIAFLIFITVEILYVVYFNFPTVESLIQADIIVESIEGEEKCLEKLLEVINKAEKGDEIYVTAYEAPFEITDDYKYYKLKDPEKPPINTIKHKEWEYYKKLHDKVVNKEILLRRLAPLIYLPDRGKNKKNEENIRCVSYWFEQHHSEITDLVNSYRMSLEQYKLKYITEPYYRRLLYLKPKDTNRSPICILGTFETIPFPQRGFYDLYIQSKALRGSIEKEITAIFCEHSEYYKGENLLTVLEQRREKKMADELGLRRIRPGEIDSELEEKLIKIQPDAFGKAHSREEVKNHIYCGDYLYLGYIRSEIIGWASIKEMGDIAHIHGIAVKREHQRKGFSTKMIENLLVCNYRYFTLDTQSPVVYYLFYKNISKKCRGEIYPYPQCEIIPEDVKKISAMIAEEFGYKIFEANRLIIRRLFEEGVIYDEIPRCESDVINKYFKDNLDCEKGDAFLIVCKIY
jgi:ribosomal protein S18 acetylase RimI-like enzyme